MADKNVNFTLTASDRTAAAFASAKRNLDGISASAGGLGRVLGAALPAFSVGALAAFAKQGIDAADAMQDLSDRTGVSVKTLAEYKLAATLADTSLESLGKGIQRLTLSIGQAEAGGKAQAKALKDLGISARDPQHAFEQLADAVANSNDPIKTNAALNDLLGRSYGELLPLLQGGSQGLRESSAASEDYADAIVRLAPEAAKLNDELDKLKIKSAGAAGVLLSSLVPALNDVIDRSGVLIDLYSAGGLFNGVMMTAGAKDFEEVLGRVRNEIKLTEEAVSSKKGRGLDSSAFEEKLRGLNAQLQILLERKAEALMAPPQLSGGDTNKPTDLGNAAQIACIADGGVWDGSRCVKKSTSSGPKIDKDSLFSDETARNAEMIADEMERIAGDAAFMAEVDIAQNNPVSAIAQEWKDAARAMVEDAKTPLEQMEDRIAYIDELMRLGLLTSDEYGKVMAKAFDDAGASAEKAQSAADEFGLTFTSALEDAIVTGESFSDMLKGLEQDIARIIVRKTITEPLMNMDWGSMLGGLLPSANGNAFAGAPGLSKYSGSVVSKPTVFPFASGIGLMGEAGAEAILPLTRGADGKLGVTGGGGSVQVNVINNANGAQASATEREENGVRIIDVMVEQVEGAMSRRLGRGEGLAPVMERRYGLNPGAGAY